MTETRFRLQLITAHIGGHERLIFGEAIGAPDPAIPTLPLESFSVATPAIASLGISILRAVVGEIEQKSLQEQITKGTVTWSGRTISVGPVTPRPALIAPVAYQGEHHSLHPDGQFTYLLQEWWDQDEALVRDLWDTRGFGDVMKAIEEKTGLSLAYNSDRIGNFLRFDRLSSWYIDRQTGLQDDGCWVRALHDGPRPVDALILNARFLAGNEVVTEETVPLPTGGVTIGVGHDYSMVSLGLFDAEKGRLLAREAGAVIGGTGRIRMGLSKTEQVTDSSGLTHPVAWTQWDGPPFDQIDQHVPWKQRSSLRALRTRRLQEHADVRLFKKGQRKAAVEMIRDIIRKSQDSTFLYIWDPYFDASVTSDFLGWLPPKIACRILCGQPRKMQNGQPIEATYNDLFTDMRAALSVLRQPPKLRQIDCHFRVQPAHKYLAIYHDRYIITLNAAWVLGASLNGIGKKEGSIVQLLDPDPLRWLFEDEWAASPAGWVEVVL